MAETKGYNKKKYKNGIKCLVPKRSWDMMLDKDRMLYSDNPDSELPKEISSETIKSDADDLRQSPVVLMPCLMIVPFRLPECNRMEEVGAWTRRKLVPQRPLLAASRGHSAHAGRGHRQRCPQ